MPSEEKGDKPPPELKPYCYRLTTDRESHSQQLVRIWDIDITQGGLKISAFPQREKTYGRLVQSMVHLSSTVEVRRSRPSLI